MSTNVNFDTICVYFTLLLDHKQTATGRLDGLSTMRLTFQILHLLIMHLQLTLNCTLCIAYVNKDEIKYSSI